MRRICQDAGILSKTLDDAITKVDEACDVCTRNGRGKPMRKISLTHVNKSFKQEVQLDFMFHVIRKEKRTVLVITDTGTGFTECCAVSQRSLVTVMQTIETIWFYQHGIPQKVSADEEFNKRQFLRFLKAHDVDYMARPAQRHNKIGIVEGKNVMLKLIINKLDTYISTAKAD